MEATKARNIWRMQTPRLFLLLLFSFTGTLFLEYILLPPIPTLENVQTEDVRSPSPIQAKQQSVLQPMNKEIIAETTYNSVEGAKARFSVLKQHGKWPGRRRGLQQHIKSDPKGPVLVELSPTNRTESRIIYFLHIHKSAGSTMCIAARENGLDTTKTNCNVQQDQRCCGGEDSLQAQQFFAKVSQHEFVANERDMYKAMDPEHYRYVVTLRNSKDRYLSHWKNIVRWYYPDYLETFSTWWNGQPDNWNFRKICGSRCMFIPKYQITRDLFQYTVDRLDLFEDILLFENFNQTFANFAQSVGWTKMPMSIGKKKVVTYPDSNGKWDPLMTALDDALYELAVARQEQGLYAKDVVFSKETKKVLEEYFTTGDLRACTTPCCSKQCSKY